MYEAENFDHLIGTPGFSDQLLQNHFTLYQGYVKNTNALAETLAKMAEDGKTGSPEYAELKRRFGWEFNGMRLHQYYFSNMTKSGGARVENSTLESEIAKEFGSFENWQKDFKSTGAMRGIGWAILYRDTWTGRLFNVWVNEHDLGHLAGGQPLLIMDVFEHAFMLDYGVKRGDYIEAFFAAIDWSVIEKRFSVKPE